MIDAAEPCGLIPETNGNAGPQHRGDQVRTPVDEQRTGIQVVLRQRGSIWSGRNTVHKLSEGLNVFIGFIENEKITFGRIGHGINVRAWQAQDKSAAFTGLTIQIDRTRQKLGQSPTDT